MTEHEMLTALRALRAYVDANIRELDAEQVHLGTLLERTRPGTEREGD